MHLRFVAIAGPHQGESFEFDPTDEIWIGRDQELAVALARDNHVDGRQCRLVQIPEGFRVYPAEGAGPIHVNGARVAESPLYPGDTLALGGSVLRFDSMAGFSTTDTVLLEQTDLHCSRCGMRLTLAESLRNLAQTSGGSEFCQPCREAAGISAAAGQDTRTALRVRGDDPMIGRRFGVYEVENFAGEGSSGVVYRARHVILNEVRALKVLDARYASDARKVRRFFQGVQAATRLSHPNIVKVFDANEIEGHYFVTMEYVRGVALDRAIREKGVLHPRLVVAIATAVASGLDHAADKHVVHRDLKPANIVLARGGIVKISDFGLAKNLDSDQDSLTREAEVFGTFAYISPEQLKSSRSADHRSDLYSLGATLYHALTGERPFDLEDAPLGVLVQRIATEPPAPIRFLNPDVPDALARIVERLMAKDPEARYQAPSDLLAELAAV